MNANILVIDDEESLRFTFERFLSLAGHNVITAGSCHEARERIHQQAFDLVFTDMSLPDGSGIDLLREITRKCPGCPVIVMTAYPGVETARDTFRMGGFDYIAKPIRHREVMQSVDLALLQNSKTKQTRTVP